MIACTKARMSPSPISVILFILASCGKWPLFLALTKGWRRTAPSCIILSSVGNQPWMLPSEQSLTRWYQPAWQVTIRSVLNKLPSLASLGRRKKGKSMSPKVISKSLHIQGDQCETSNEPNMLCSPGHLGTSRSPGPFWQWRPRSVYQSCSVWCSTSVKCSLWQSLTETVSRTFSANFEFSDMPATRLRRGARVCNASAYT